MLSLVTVCMRVCLCVSLTGLFIGTLTPLLYCSIQTLSSGTAVSLSLISLLLRFNCTLCFYYLLLPGSPSFILLSHCPLTLAVFLFFFMDSHDEPNSALCEYNVTPFAFKLAKWCNYLKGNFCKVEENIFWNMFALHSPRLSPGID